MLDWDLRVGEVQGGVRAHPAGFGGEQAGTQCVSGAVVRRVHGDRIAPLVGIEVIGCACVCNRFGPKRDLAGSRPVSNEVAFDGLSSRLFDRAAAP